MNNSRQKRNAAEAVIPHLGHASVIGVGSGTTVEYFIEALADIRGRLDATVSSSEHTTLLLRKHNIPVVELNELDSVPIYVDGADEATHHGSLIKGGGGALTREKIVAAASSQFICIVDESKLVDVLGDFGVPIEVIPMARSFVAREIRRLGASPRWREGFITDNGNVILDARGLRILNPLDLETQITLIPGVVTVGLFAHRKADLILVGKDSGIEKIRIS